ncbi:MAG: DinB family protein [Chloroflexota bacterium]|nr:DinB family protein [Chloroflexota bacterium]
MEDSRRDTLTELEGVTDGMIDARPPGGENTIGATLYHVALIEADWLFDDLLGLNLGTTELAPLFPFDARDEQGILTGVAGVPLAEHLDRLARVRSVLIDRIGPMSIEDFTTPRAREGYDLSPVWMIHHLLQHESEHRSEIGWLRRHCG